MKKISSFLILVFVLLIPGLALAEEAAGAAPPIRTVDDLVRLLVTTAVVAGLSWLGKKVGGLLDKSKAGKAVRQKAETFRLEQMIADAAIHYAEEKALQAAKRAARGAGHVLTSHEKLAAALEYAEAHGLVEDAIGRVGKIIEARLGVHREFAPKRTTQS